MESLALQLFMEILVNLDPQEMWDLQEHQLVILLTLHMWYCIPLLIAHNNPMCCLLVSDLHCRVQMAPLVCLV